jgi:uncharacterized membrane protein
MASKTLFEKTIEIQAPPERVWAVMRDVERWAEWTASISSIKIVGAAPLGVGSFLLIRQPKLIPAKWRVTQWEEGKGFVSINATPGLSVTAKHWIEPTNSGSHVMLSIQFEGLLAPLVAGIFANLNERYLTLESQGLKRRSEEN